MNYPPALRNKHRIAVVGLGGIAQACHLPAYAEYAGSLGFEVVAGAEPDDERRKSVRESSDFPVFASVTEMLRAVAPDVVDVTVPPGAAKDEVIRECLAAGCHVLAQKPLMLGTAEASSLVQAADEAGRLLAVNMQARYAPAFAAAKEAVAAARAGAVLSAFVHSSYPLPGDTTVAMGIHEMDLLRFWIGLDPLRVRSTFRPLRDERAQVVVEVDFGSAVGLILEENHSAVALPWSFRIHGESAVLHGWEQFGTAEPASAVLLAEGQPPQPLELSYSYNPAAFAYVMASLLAAVETGSQPPTSGRDHLISLAGVVAAQEAATSGQVVEVEVPR